MLKLILHATPALVAIAILELVNVAVYLHGPVSKNLLFLLLWLILQMIPGFVFGYISDLHFRKKTLLISQFLGLIGGVILFIFGFELWVLILLAATFNPMPVARASLLDNYPHYSTLRIISVTLIAQYIPWAFYNNFASFPWETISVWILVLLSANILLTLLFFHDNYDHRKPKNAHKLTTIIKNNKSIIYTIIAFTLAETTFFLLMAYIETDHIYKSWLSSMTYGTLIGIIIAMIYSRLPHMSIITLFYSIGASITFMALLRCAGIDSFCINNFITAMSYYDIVGGLYLPFVTSGVIDMLGPRYRAFGSASVELGDTIASFMGPVLALLIQAHSGVIFGTITVLYILAASTQKYAEKSSKI